MLERRDLSVHKDPKATLVLRVITVFKERKVTLDRREHKVT